jgi:intracellular sulfur oxidation DsrE/DsrF family protein
MTTNAPNPDLEKNTSEGPRRRFLRTLSLGLTGIAVASSAQASQTTPHTLKKPGARDHRVVFQVDSSDETIMRHAIGGSINLSRYYGDKHEPLSIEIVANAAGILMFRADITPLAEPIRGLRQLIPGLTLSVCGSSKAIAEQKEGRELVLLEGVQVVPYGVGRLVDLQEAGWGYVHA